MADEVDEVIDQYEVKGLDPSVLDGVIENPPEGADDKALRKGDTRSSQEAAKVVVAGVIEKETDPVAPSPEKPPEQPTNLPELAEQVGLHAPDSSEIRKALTNPAANDRLLEVIRKDDSTVTILNTAMEEIAEDAAYIKAWRNTVWDGQKDVSEAALSRIKMLSELVKTIIEREKLKEKKSIGKVDFHSENFQNVLKYFMSIIVGTFKKVQIPSQFEDIFFTQLAKDFGGFEKKAEKIYYGKDAK